MGEDSETRDKLMLWLNGPAGSGKSAIGHSIAERCKAEGRLLATFFFGRSDSRRNQSKPLVATIAYQIYTNTIPAFRHKMITVIENNPLIFDQTLQVQIESLIIIPLRTAIHSGYFENPNSRRVIIIDGLDECIARTEQQNILLTILYSITQLKCPFLFFVASRPEPEIAFFFNSDTARNIHSRITLSNEYDASEDIRLYLRKEFKYIKESHPFKHLIPTTWPAPKAIDKLVAKSSGQFIYAATVIKYVKSLRHRPDHRLDIVLDIRPRASVSDMPFAELDALYTMVLSAVDDLPSVLHALNFFIHGASWIPSNPLNTATIEKFGFLDTGSIEVMFSDLAALIAIENKSIIFWHASFQDYLLDPMRSREFYVDPKFTFRHIIQKCFRIISSESALLA